MSGGGRQGATAASDWARTPSAMFAAALLGTASLCTLGIALSREVQRDATTVETIALSGSPAATSPAGSGPRESVSASRPSAVRLINVNIADLGELDLLPGIGPALGQRIIEYRRAHGPFESIDALERVSGIGPRTLDKLRPLVTLGEESPLPADASAQAYTTDN